MEENCPHMVNAAQVLKVTSIGEGGKNGYWYRYQGDNNRGWKKKKKTNDVFAYLIVEEHCEGPYTLLFMFLDTKLHRLSHGKW